MLNKTHLFLGLTLLATADTPRTLVTKGIWLTPFNQQRLVMGKNAKMYDQSEYTRKYHPAVVMVNNLDGSSGTGFFIKLPDSGKKVLVTASHVCGTAKALFSSKGVHEVLYQAPERDTCILSTFQGVSTVNLAGGDIAKGDYISTIGFPLRLQWDFRRGLAGEIGLSFFNLPLSFYNGCPAPTGTVVSDDEGVLVCGLGVSTISAVLKVRLGNSGGPAFNYYGNVVGIVIATDNMGTGFIVPVSELKEVLSRVKQ